MGTESVTEMAGEKTAANFFFALGIGTTARFSLYLISVDMKSPSTLSYNITHNNTLKRHINTSTFTATSGMLVILLAPVIFHPSYRITNKPYKIQ